jgi:uncharacterized membrane protein YoaK (UPF0700 family)
MYRLEREDFVKSPFISLWATLGFQAGFLNAFGFLACGRYVSHVTGFGTQIGGAIAESKILLAFELLGFPISFILGAFFSSLLTSARLERGRVPRYDLITVILPSLLILLLMTGKIGWFGIFGGHESSLNELFLLFILSFVCGVQNGCFATLTKGQIRTTHLTGISTDIGTDFARMWFGKLNPQEYALTRKTNISRLSTFLAFATGSVLSVLISREIGYLALVVPILTSVIVYFSIKKTHRLLDKRFKIELRKNEPGFNNTAYQR